MKIGMIPIGRKEALHTKIWTDIGLRKVAKNQDKPCQIMEFNAASKLPVFEFKTDHDGNMSRLVETLQRSVKDADHAGAKLAFIPHHIPREAFEKTAMTSPIKLVNIVDAVTDECRSKGHRSVCFMGPSWMVEDKLYKTSFADVGISVVSPSEQDQKSLQSMITLSEHTKNMTQGSQEKIQMIFKNLQEKYGFSALLMTNFQLMPLLHSEFTQVENLNPYKILANHVVALATAHSSALKKASSRVEHINSHPIAASMISKTHKRGAPYAGDIWK